MTILSHFRQVTRKFVRLKRTVGTNDIGENTLSFTETTIKGVLLEDENFLRKSGEHQGEGGANYTEGRLYILTKEEIYKDDRIREEDLEVVPPKIDTYIVATVKPVYNIATGAIDHYKAFLVDID